MWDLLRSFFFLAFAILLPEVAAKGQGQAEGDLFVSLIIAGDFQEPLQGLAYRLISDENTYTKNDLSTSVYFEGIATGSPSPRSTRMCIIWNQKT